jgi:hypothetical protein
MEEISRKNNPILRKTLSVTPYWSKKVKSLKQN